MKTKPSKIFRDVTIITISLTLCSIQCKHKEKQASLIYNSDNELISFEDSHYKIKRDGNDIKIYKRSNEGTVIGKFITGDKVTTPEGQILQSSITWIDKKRAKGDVLNILINQFNLTNKLTTSDGDFVYTARVEKSETSDKVKVNGYFRIIETDEQIIEEVYGVEKGQGKWEATVYKKQIYDADRNPIEKIIAIAAMTSSGNIIEIIEGGEYIPLGAGQSTVIIDTKYTSMADDNETALMLGIKNGELLVKGKGRKEVIGY